MQHFGVGNSGGVGDLMNACWNVFACFVSASTDRAVSPGVMMIYRRCSGHHCRRRSISSTATAAIPSTREALTKAVHICLHVKLFTKKRVCELWAIFMLYSVQNTFAVIIYSHISQWWSLNGRNGKFGIFSFVLAFWLAISNIAALLYNEKQQQIGAVRCRHLTKCEHLPFTRAERMDLKIFRKEHSSTHNYSTL